MLAIHDAQGRPLWDGAVPLTDTVDGLPYGVLGVPGRDLGLEMQLRRLSDGTTVLLMLPYRVTGTNPDGSPIRETTGRSHRPSARRRSLVTST